jgi:hypothetical protein
VAVNTPAEVPREPMRSLYWNPRSYVSVHVLDTGPLSFVELNVMGSSPYFKLMVEGTGLCLISKFIVPRLDVDQ